jgi:hypothetical protein
VDKGHVEAICGQILEVQVKKNLMLLC